MAYTVYRNCPGYDDFCKSNDHFQGENGIIYGVYPVFEKNAFFPIGSDGKKAVIIFGAE